MQRNKIKQFLLLFCPMKGLLKTLKMFLWFTMWLCILISPQITLTFDFTLIFSKVNKPA